MASPNACLQQTLSLQVIDFKGSLVLKWTMKKKMSLKNNDTNHTVPKKFPMIPVILK